MNNPAFILRFTEGLTKDGLRMLTVWTPEHNLLQVDRELYDLHERLDKIIIERSYRDIAADEKFRD